MIKEIQYICIQNDSIEVNGEDFSIINDQTSFFKSVYKGLGIDYPKFYKMDALSKLGFLAVEILKQKIEVKDDFADELAMLFYNSNSCQESDLKYWQNVQNGKANPSLFVYTLPNIVLGEISIYNKWFGESLFLIQNEEDNFEIESIIESWFILGKAKYCICCNLEYHDDSQYFVNLRFLSKK
jgi:hypothetical protein